MTERNDRLPQALGTLYRGNAPRSSEIPRPVEAEAKILQQVDQREETHVQFRELEENRSEIQRNKTRILKGKWTVNTLSAVQDDFKAAQLQMLRIEKALDKFGGANELLYIRLRYPDLQRAIAVLLAETTNALSELCRSVSDEDRPRIKAALAELAKISFK